MKIGKASHKREKQEWTLEKPKLENARNLRGIYFIDPSDEDYRDIMKNARRNLETPMAAAMPCKRTIAQTSNRETIALKSGKAEASKMRTSFSCIAEAHESTKQRVESVTKRSHEDQNAGKGQNPVLHNNLLHKFIPMPQAMKILDAKAAVDKELKKLETIPAWQLDNVKSKKEVIKEAQKNNNKVHFASLMDLCHLKNAELDPPLQKHKGRVVLRGDIVKDDSRAYAAFTEQGSSATRMNLLSPLLATKERSQLLVTGAR